MKIGDLVVDKGPRRSNGPPSQVREARDRGVGVVIAARRYCLPKDSGKYPMIGGVYVTTSLPPIVLVTVAWSNGEVVELGKKRLRMAQRNEDR
jgi:hypothetical protein